MGGLVYHYRAWRYSKKLWGEHKNQVSQFLELWNPPRKTLVLIGPSGGYSLPLEWIGQFEKVVALEPDPVARWIFEMRFKRKPLWLKDFREIQRFENESYCILFCNLLGQINLETTTGIGFLLKQLVSGRPWASYHDIFSGPAFSFEHPIQSPYGKLTIEEIKNKISVKQHAGVVELNDHATLHSFEPTDREKFLYWSWALTPNQTQLIEGVLGGVRP